MICIQTLTGCFPPKRLVDLGLYASIFSGVSVRLCSCLLCVNVTTSVPFYHTFHPVLPKRVMLNYWSNFDVLSADSTPGQPE